MFFTRYINIYTHTMRAALPRRENRNTARRPLVKSHINLISPIPTHPPRLPPPTDIAGVENRSEHATLCALAGLFIFHAVEKNDREISTITRAPPTIARALRISVVGSTRHKSRRRKRVHSDVRRVGRLRSLSLSLVRRPFDRTRAPTNDPTYTAVVRDRSHRRGREKPVPDGSATT